MPCGDESRLLENSGWSSRTRSVRDVVYFFPLILTLILVLLAIIFSCTFIRLAHILMFAHTLFSFRAVAKYLQNLFEDEAIHGRKVLSMDSLLDRKTRKEASRMFFETLVRLLKLVSKFVTFFHVPL